MNIFKEYEHFHIFHKTLMFLICMYLGNTVPALWSQYTMAADDLMNQVSEWFSLTAFLRTADIKVHTSRVIIAYTLKSLSSLT